MKKFPSLIIGIDEAGRGPLAGPVSVGLVLVPSDFDWALLPGVNDSKKLSARKREELFTQAELLQKAGKLLYVVELVSATKIDTHGISVCIKKAIARGLQSLITTASMAHQNKKDPKSIIPLSPLLVQVKLDGSLKAPAEFVHQETIIKGDAKEKVIGLASIMAKVTRDRYMCKLATKPAYVPYDFTRHKGYGTSAHRQAIAKHGLSTLHRISYCRNIDIVV